ncbi:MAG: sensor domain-containing diguanylate cyclase [bacterium]|nr:sensor domain-containing diguanylate cyclase [bacterium]
MKPAPIPADEPTRLASLRDYDILDTLPEQAYDDITFVASRICDAPIAAVSLVDDDRQWFKSRVGLKQTQTPREVAFCAHAILKPDQLMVVPDALNDERFVDNPLVVEDPKVRFYAGAPLRTVQGSALGTLCVVDHRPRRLDAERREALLALSRQVVAQLDLRKAVAKLRLNQDRLEQSNEHLRVQSLTDPLTGLGNRAAFDTRLREEIHRARRYEQPLSLVLMDVDNFKSFNDQFGHAAGDTVLGEMAGMLKAHSRSSDLAARYGGEEFAVILPNTGPDGAWLVAERFREAMDSTVHRGRPVTISVGVAAYSESAATRRELIEHADRALYTAKRRGRNLVVRAPGPSDEHDGN